MLVIEHKPETISIADHVVDLGPGAGSRGGRICFEGTVEQLHRSDTLTGRHMADRVRLKSSHRSPTDMMRIRHAKTNNLRDVDVDIPVGVLTVITGVAGSGKSSLIHGHLSPMDGVVTIDQAPIKGSRRSNAATYTGLLDPIRKAFAKANKDKGAKPAHFSANSEGACPVCGGTGIIETQLGFMETVESRCVACEGRRFKDEVLAFGLHPADIEAMLALLDHLVDCGRSVVVIEHHEAVMAHADWIIDLGPGAGHDGGHVVFTGTPTRMVAERTTLTRRYLARYVEEGNDGTPE